VFGKFFRTQPKAAPEAAPAAEPKPQSAPEVVFDVGLIDMVRSGWFSNDSGELYPGFPVGPEDTVVDVGCGDGSKTGFCARRGAHVVFADIDPSAVAAARMLMESHGAARLTPFVTDGVKLPLADGTASRVVASEVLEHVDDPAEFLTELVRVGKPGALYLLTVPDPVAETLRKQIVSPRYFEKPGHIRIVGREEFGQLVTDAGLVIERRGSNGFHSSLWWILRYAEDEPSDQGNSLRKLWDDTWGLMLSMPEGARIKAALDDLMPMSQCIVARKP
jgi:SAM-dependent methyltransferase